jgi:hypothetical protein
LEKCQFFGKIWTLEKQKGLGTLSQNRQIFEGKKKSLLGEIFATFQTQLNFFGADFFFGQFSTTNL